MGRPALSQEHRSTTRLRIHDAAVALYREAGLDGITMRAVAARSGVAASALYGYYRDRSALLEALWREPAGAAAREVAAIASTVVPPVERIEKMLDVYLKLAEENPEIYRGAFMYVRPGSRPKPATLPLGEVELHRQLVQALSDGCAQGLFASDDVQLDAQCFWATLHGALALPVNIERFEFAPSRELAKRALATMIEGLQPRSPNAFLKP